MLPATRITSYNVCYTKLLRFKVLKAIESVVNQGIAIPILLGDESAIRKLAVDNGIDISNLQIIDVRMSQCDVTRERFAKLLFEKRQRKGLTMEDRNNFV